MKSPRRETRSEKEAGYSHGAVYSNFAGKADLFLAVFGESFLLHLEFLSGARREPQLAERFGNRSAALREAIAAYIAHYQEEEGLEAPLPPADLALILRALGIGLAIEALVSPEAVRDDLYGDFVEL